MPSKSAPPSLREVSRICNNGGALTIGGSLVKAESNPDPSGIVVRPCTSLAEFDTCVELQKAIWRYADVDVVPSALFVVASKSGGHVLGAFDRERMIGFALGFAAFRGGARYVHSHMAGVLPEYRDLGVGRRLKLLQREICLQSGIQQVEWTFDPLELKNAHFNIVRLGVVVRKILPNLYGITTSRLHGTLPTDRLVAEWAIASPRVEAVLAGRAAMGKRAAARVTLPANIAEMRQSDPEIAKREQSQAREEFERHFAVGLAVTGFERGEQAASYLLEKWSARSGSD